MISPIIAKQPRNYKIEKMTSEHQIKSMLTKVKIQRFKSKPMLQFTDKDLSLFIETSHEAQLSYYDNTTYVDYITNKLFKKQTNILVLSTETSNKTFIKKLFDTYHIPDKCIKKTYITIHNSFTCIIAFSSFIFYSNNNSSILCYTDENDETFLNFLGLIKPYIKKKTPINNTISVIRSSMQGIDTVFYNLPKVSYNIHDNYNDDIVEMTPEIIKSLNENYSSGLYIFNGSPGVGKTTYIKYLISKLKKRVIFVPPNIINIITDPSFISFLMENENTILVIEDGENILKPRANGGNSAVSNLLNVSDGLLSSCVNVKFIVTFNENLNKIDSALLRKGRLKYQYTFEDLSNEKSKLLMQKLYPDINLSQINIPTVLSDVYNYKKNPTLNKTKKTSIGFK